jgi:hypothetical protein
MEWKIAITNKPNERIVVRFDPKNQYLVFIGQYKPKNRGWIDFILINKQFLSIDTKMMEYLITAEEIQETLLSTYNILKKRVDVYNNIAEGFTVIKEIQILDKEE